MLLSECWTSVLPVSNYFSKFQHALDISTALALKNLPLLNGCYSKLNPVEKCTIAPLIVRLHKKFFFKTINCHKNKSTDTIFKVNPTLLASFFNTDPATIVKKFTFEKNADEANFQLAYLANELIKNANDEFFCSNLNPLMDVESFSTLIAQDSVDFLKSHNLNGSIGLAEVPPTTLGLSVYKTDCSQNSISFDLPESRIERSSVTFDIDVPKCDTENKENVGESGSFFATKSSV